MRGGEVRSGERTPYPPPLAARAAEPAEHIRNNKMAATAAHRFIFFVGITSLFHAAYSAAQRKRLTLVIYPNALSDMSRFLKMHTFT